MFLDLNVPYETTVKCFEVGYHGLAWNRTVTGKLTQEHVADNTQLPLPSTSKESEMRIKGTKTNFAQYSRLTCILEDQSQIHSLSPTSTVIKSYDILAVQPTTDKLLHECCESLDVDVICFDFSRRLDFPLKATTLALAIQRGIYFEISYSPTFAGVLFAVLQVVHLDQDPSSRRHLLSNAMNLVRSTRGKNIIITSQAKKAFDVRSPYDIANLGTLFGLEFDISKRSVSSNCESTILKGATRQTHKAVFKVEQLETQLKDEGTAKDIIGGITQLLRDDRDTKLVKRKRS